MIDVLVLGSGWAGVVFALEFMRRFPSASVAVVDRDFSRGLLGSVEVGGHVFDVGGGGSHVIFSGDSGMLVRVLALLWNNVVARPHNFKERSSRALYSQASGA